MPWTYSPDVVAEEFDDETVLVNLQSNWFYTLNATAARLWHLIGKSASHEEIKRQMLAEFDVGEQQVDREISSLLYLLEKEGLVYKE